MKRMLIALAVLTLCAAASPQAEIDRGAAAVAGMEAQFTHSFTPKGFSKAQVENGTVIFGKLPMMRWTYNSPEPKTFVFDGSRTWFYVPSDKQVTIADLDDQRKRELPFLLVGDPAARDRYFVVSEQQRGRAVTTTLRPRDASGLIRGVSIVSNAWDHRIQAIEYTDRDGNRTAFAFSGYHPARVSPDTFSFTVPAGVQVVHGD
ncbi:MAG TPA: outer membrane lipoprotein carrier protein LolA [Thermoanaerobaculia bacterium]|nr:outer membrane lipoprotein carrier protein LolA [Thermoanaerobaculia bacterium]